MKTLEQIQKEHPYGMIYLTEDFIDIVLDGGFAPCDGIGYFHDGDKETKISVWSDLKYEDIINYPYVCWYNN